MTPSASIPMDWLAVQRKQKSNNKSNYKECSDNHDSNDAVTSNKRLRKPHLKVKIFMVNDFGSNCLKVVHHRVYKVSIISYLN